MRIALSIGAAFLIMNLVTFAVIEIGQAIAPNYSWTDAMGGILAEAIYFPVAVLAIRRLLGSKPIHASA